MNMVNHKKEISNLELERENSGLADDKGELKRVIQIKGRRLALVVGAIFSIFGIGAGTICSLLDDISRDLDDISCDLDDISCDLDDISRGLDDISDGLQEINLLLDDILDSLERNRKTSQISQGVDEADQVLYDYEEYHDLLKDLDKDSYEYTQMFTNLLKVRKKLNISSKEDKQYADILSIGDCVNLVGEEASIYNDIYSVDKQENATTSLYGTGEIRLIHSIIMSNHDMVTEVDNMDDYELFKSIGFEVKGYNLVNQFSLEKDGSLTSEFRCGDDALKLEKRMDTRLKR